MLSLRELSPLANWPNGWVAWFTDMALEVKAELNARNAQRLEGGTA